MCPWLSAVAVEVGPSASDGAPPTGADEHHHHHQPAHLPPSAVLVQQHLAQLHSDGGKYKQSVFGSCRYATVSKVFLFVEFWVKLNILKKVA